jgi:hypothetical protein
VSENVHTIKARAVPYFQRHGTVPPEPNFGEEPARYQRRMLSLAQSMLGRGHVWAEQNLSRQPDRALDTIQHSIFYDRAEPQAGELVEYHEACPRTGRVVTRFEGDQEVTWAPFKQQPRRARFTPGVGRGADSPVGRESGAAAAMRTLGMR